VPVRWRELATVGAALQLVSLVWFVVLVIVTLDRRKFQEVATTTEPMTAS
jgi:hypothetical protein